MTPYAKGYGAGWQSYLEEHHELKHTFSRLLPSRQPPVEYANYGLTPSADYWLGYYHGRATAKTWVTRHSPARREEEVKNRKPKYKFSAERRGSGGVSPRRKVRAETDAGQNETLTIRLPTAVVVHLRHWAFMKEVSLAAFIEEALTRFCRELAVENKKQVQETEVAQLLFGNASLITKREKNFPCSPPKAPPKEKLKAGVFAR
ncbi:MAG TPA: hypothetical protein VGX03_30610 [Candidatus Binatia bacterium]|jgi:hypothetical protein|nr:hypothetical protein [Candidatus Binatia bacterium]